MGRHRDDPALDGPHLRHTASPHLREDLGVRDDVVEALLAHVSPGLADATPIYLRAHLLAERRAALISWGSWLDQLVAGGVVETPRVLPFQ